MKKMFFFLLFSIFISNNIFAQQMLSTDDKMARISFAVHLITYDTISAFESAKGEAYYKMLIDAFSKNAIIPDFMPSDLSSHDRNKINKIILQLRAIKSNPPSWDELYRQETQYLIWKDKVTR